MRFGQDSMVHHPTDEVWSLQQEEERRRRRGGRLRQQQQHKSEMLPLISNEFSESPSLIICGSVFLEDKTPVRTNFFFHFGVAPGPKKSNNELLFITRSNHMKLTPNLLNDFYVLWNCLHKSRHRDVGWPLLMINKLNIIRIKKQLIKSIYHP